MVITMKLFICIDDNGGIAFNGRRQSRDSVVIGDILTSVGDSVLRISDYSKKLFPDSASMLSVSDNYLDSAETDDFVFVEKETIGQYSDRITELTVYHWNRTYPADMYFDIDLGDFVLAETSEFVGTSHEKITKEVYKR